MFLRPNNVICKLMNTFIPHLPPCLTCGLIPLLSWLCQVPSFNPLCVVANVYASLKALGLGYGETLMT